MDAQRGQPITIFLKSIQQNGVTVHRQHLGWRVPPWETNNESIIQQVQIKPLKIPGRWHHITMMIVPRFAGTVKHKILSLAVFEQTNFVLLASGGEISDSFIQRHRLAHKWHVLLDKLQHGGFDAIQVSLTKIGNIVDLAVIPPGGNGMINRQTALGEAASECDFQQKYQGAAVNPRAIGIFHRQQSRIPVLPNRVGQFPQVPIQDRANNQRLIWFLHNAGKIFQSPPAFSCDNPTIA